MMAAAAQASIAKLNSVLCMDITSCELFPCPPDHSRSVPPALPYDSRVTCDRPFDTNRPVHIGAKG